MIKVGIRNEVLSQFLVILTVTFHLAIAEEKDFHRGGNLVVGLLGEVKDLHSLWSIDFNSRMVIGNVQEGLYLLDEDGYIRPHLAVDFPIKINPTTYLIPLREEVFFHNGEKFTAQNVALPLELLKDSGTHYPSKDVFSNIKGWEIVNQHLIKIELFKPDIFFTLLFARQETYPLSRKTLDLYGDAYGKATIIGTGAYKLANWDKGEELILSANEQYWGKEDDIIRARRMRKLPQDAYILSDENMVFEFKEKEKFKKIIDQQMSFSKNARALPYIEKVVFRFIKSEKERFEAINNYRIHFIPDLGYEYWQEAINGDDKYFLIGHKNSLVSLIYLNINLPPFDNAMARKALDKLIDKDKLREMVYWNYADKGDKPIPLWMMPQTLPVDNLFFNHSPVVKEKILLEKEKLGNFTLIYTDEPHLRKLAQFLKDSFKNLNWEVEFQAVNKEEMLKEIYCDQGESCQFQAALEDWQNFRRGILSEQILLGLYTSFYGKTKAKFKNETLENLALILKSPDSIDEYKETLREFMEEVENQKPIIILAFPYEISLQLKNVSSIERDAQGFYRFMETKVN